MGAIDRRPNGRWRGRYRDGLGRQHSKHFDRKIDARRWLAAVDVSRSRGEWVDPSLARITVGDWGRQWLAIQFQLKPSTRVRYELALERHVLPTWERVRLASVCYSDVAEWVGELVEAGLAPATVRYAHRVFSLVLGHAVRAGRLARNPAEGVPLPRVARKAPVFLDHAEVAALARACEPYGLLVRFLAYTGLRWGEATALRVHRVDLVRRRVTVASAFVSIGGKLVEGTPKSHQARPVPLPRFLVVELADHVVGRRRTDLVFSMPSGAPLRGSNFRQRCWLPAVKELGLDGVRVHDLRHTAASLAVKSGANPKVMQQMLGHASAAMTLDVYSGLFDADLDEVAERLDEAVGKLAGVSLVCPEGDLSADEEAEGSAEVVDASGSDEGVARAS